MGGCSLDYALAHRRHHCSPWAQSVVPLDCGTNAHVLAAPIRQAAGSALDDHTGERCPTAVDGLLAPDSTAPPVPSHSHRTLAKVPHSALKADVAHDVGGLHPHVADSCPTILGPSRTVPAVL
jgi:hypothetical protein